MEKDYEVSIEMPRIYPFKGGGSVYVNEVHVGREGLEGDRQWAAFDPKTNNFLSQRNPGFQKLALIEPELEPDGRVRLWYENSSSILLQHPTEAGERCTVKVWGDTCEAEEDTKASEWLSDNLGQECMVARKAGTRQIGRLDAPADATISWADRYHVLGIHISTIAKLNELLSDNGLTESLDRTLARLRPNLIFTGGEGATADAHAENHFETIGIDVVTLNGVRPCERCTVPYVDQRTGEPDALVKQVLEANFIGANGKVVVGENFIVSKPGVIANNDTVTVQQLRLEGHGRPYRKEGENKR